MGRGVGSERGRLDVGESSFVKEGDVGVMGGGGGRGGGKRKRSEKDFRGTL